MADFDPQRLKDRAIRRHAKVTKTGTRNKRLTESARLVRELEVISGLEALVGWCNFRRISVNFTNKYAGGLYYNEEKTIYINAHQTLERQLYVLLHECGHLLIDDRSESTEFRFKNGYHSAPDTKRKFIYRCTVLEEEFEAWHRGRKLATKLEIKVDDDMFYALKAKFLKSYMKWALGDPRYKNGLPE